MSFEIRERQVGPVTVVEISGRMFGIPSYEELDHKLQELLAGGHEALLIDCTQLSAIDSAGIKALVRGHLSAERHGGKFKLLRPSGRVLEVLNITRVLTVLEAFDDEEAALKSFGAPPPQSS